MTARRTSKTARAPDSLLEFLHEQVQEAVAPLAGVGRKKMLVSTGWTTRDRVFALVSRQGRIVVRVPDEAVQRELLALGADTWKFATRSPPRGWLLLPESMHDDVEQLQFWVRRAWELGAQAREKTPRARKRAAKKRRSMRRA